MRLQRSQSDRLNRRGMILLIVLVMLTLFVIAGITFVLLANAAAESANLSRQSETEQIADMDPNAAFSYFLGQLIYGVSNTDNSGPFSALRGHSLAETMYGSFDAQGAVPMDVPYNGAGAMHTTGAPPGTASNPWGLDDYTLPNFMAFPSDNFVRDPARLGTRANVGAAPGIQFIGQNAPYTFPDRNSMFLASIQASTGQVLTPSYLRPGNFNPAADWANAQGKYKILRPRPMDMGPGFPMPDPATLCDLKNLVNMPGGNDSIWIDINAPELVTAAGVKYKMLVAPLVLDLDNRINLNVVGNVLGAGNAHASNQGWGPSEINMGKVLNANGTEWQNLFLNNNGRYGPGHLPLALFTLQGSTPHSYGPGDLNGLNDPGQPGAGSPTGIYNLPGAGGVPPYSAFPSWPAAGYGNNQGGVLETTVSGVGPPFNHPMFFSPMLSVSGNKLFSIQSNASLLWAGVPGSALSDLVQLCPINFSANAVRPINQTTVLSMDLDRPGAAPYVFDPTNPAYGISYNSVTGAYSYGTPAANPFVASFPPLSSRSAAPPAGSDFNSSTWQYTPPVITNPPPGVVPAPAGPLPRIDLNRQLAAYPASGVQPADREQFAWDIYTRLLAVTGSTYYYNNIGNAAITTPAQYNTLRWLAQLSANIVDYIDTDDVMTVFQWTATPQAPDTGYVFGTELPKLVVNEVYLEYDNDQADPGTVLVAGVPTKVAQRAYHVNAWAELVNPLPSTPDLNGANVNNAVLQNTVGGQPNTVYQLVLTKQNTGIRNPANLAGDPDGTGGTNPPFFTQPYTNPPNPPLNGDFDTGPQVLAIMNQWGAVQNVTPVGTTTSIAPGAAGASSQGFLVVGPPNPPLFAGQNANTQVQIQPSVTALGTGATNNMSYKVEVTDPNANPAAGTTLSNNLAPTVLLQRLANPYQLFNPVTNPYITVDYADMKAVGGALNKPVINDARGFDVNGQIAGAPSTPNSRVSFGRKQLYAANASAGASSQWQQQAAPAPLTPNQPNTTFFNVNTPPNPLVPSDWLVHLDRPLISPIELLQVSGFKPHELTQQFVDATGKKFGHVAPWTDPTGGSRLYRLLEFVRTKNATPGIANGGRVPGKININTLDPTSIQVFEALCDAQPGNTFYYSGGAPVGDANVDAAFAALITARTNSGPFWGVAQGAYPNTDAQFPPGTPASTQSTVLQAAAAAAAAQPGVHPYQQLEMLNKIFNNVTTRSNCFAVWLTVGFFQVTNDTVQPIQLGPEINQAVGKNIRHHMFAIVDRTQIQTFTTNVGVGGVGVGNNPINVPPAVIDPRTGRTWSTNQNGTTLVYDPGAFHFNAGTASPDPTQSNEETVVVQGGAATFQYPHPPGTKVISRGHPGPWLRYDKSQDGAVVPYVVIID